MKQWTVDEIEEAAAVLKQDGLVAFPTETVYGLGGNGLKSATAAAIYRAKGRPQDNPLILHIADPEDMVPLVKDVPPAAWALADAFWPGPLTMILEKSALVPYETTGGLETVAIRLPDSEPTRALIRACGFPLAGPSANRSGKPSPTEEAHVIADLDGRIDGILLGGPTTVGLESTIIDLTVDPPQILRPGAIGAEDVATILEVAEAEPIKADAKPKAPGMKYRHYAPEAPVKLVAEADFLEAVRQAPRPVGVLASQSLLAQLPPEADIISYSLGDDVRSAAHELFRGLRALDKANPSVIITHRWPKTGLGIALMNRLEKVAGAFEKESKTV